MIAIAIIAFLFTFSQQSVLMSLHNVLYLTGPFYLRIYNCYQRLSSVSIGIDIEPYESHDALILKHMRGMMTFSAWKYFFALLALCEGIHGPCNAGLQCFPVVLA